MTTPSVKRINRSFSDAPPTHCSDVSIISRIASWVSREAAREFLVFAAQAE